MGNQIIEINRTGLHNANSERWRIDVTQGKIADEAELFAALEKTIPYQKGITSTQQVNNTLWYITNKK